MAIINTIGNVFDRIEGVLGNNKGNGSGKFNVNGFSSEIGQSGFFRPCLFMVVIKPPSALNFFKNLDPRSLPMRIESAELPSRTLMTIEQAYNGPVRRMPYKYNAIPMTLSCILSEDGREREFFHQWQDLMLGTSRREDAPGFQPNESIPYPGYGKFLSHYYEDGVVGASIQIHAFSESTLGQSEGQNKALTTVAEVARAVGFDPSTIVHPFGLDIPRLSSLFGEGIDAVQPLATATLMEPWPLEVTQVPLSWGDDGYARVNVQIQYRYSTDFIPSQSAVDNGVGVGDILRRGLGIFNQVKPIVSLITNSGVNQIVKNAKNSLTAQWNL